MTMSRAKAIEHFRWLSTSMSQEFGATAEEAQADEDETRAALVALGCTDAELDEDATLGPFATCPHGDHLADRPCGQCARDFPPN